MHASYELPQIANPSGAGKGREIWFVISCENADNDLQSCHEAGRLLKGDCLSFLSGRRMDQVDVRNAGAGWGKIGS